MIRPSGAYWVEPAAEGTRVTLNPHPEVQEMGRLMAPLMGVMIRRLNRPHLDALRREMERWRARAWEED